ncbi:MAG: CvpA family protein [Candidatus Tritonobacter lacicola]|nr:CvpA family protein [Candidatus Tritonobacter lacicola]
MYLDIAILVYLVLLGIIGLWKGLARQVLLAVSFAGSAVTVYIFRDNLLAALAAGFNTRGFAARLVLLVPIILLGFIIYRILAFLAKPLMKSRRRMPGAIFAVLRGLATAAIFLLLCDLAYPTLELRLPGIADGLLESGLFRGVQTFNRSKFNPLVKWQPFAGVRDIFLSPIDYEAWTRLQEDPGYRELQATGSLVELNRDEAYVTAVQEGRLCDAAKNPKLLQFLNDEEAYRAFQAFFWSQPEAGPPEKIEIAPTNS